MTNSYDLALPGCTPEPLMAYLKAFGILRLVSEQKDDAARGWWQDDVFWLRSLILFAGTTSDEEKRSALVRFFLEDYRPTPIVGPWAGGSGFFKKDNKKAVAELRKSTAARVGAYSGVIRRVEAIIEEERVADKPSGDDKNRLIRRYRNELPLDVVAWMDAAMVIQQDRLLFAPLLGTGGNDGRLDFTQNFMQRIVRLGLHSDDPSTDPSPSGRWLAHSLFSDPTTLLRDSVGQFAPGRAGGPNATQGMEGEPADDPWGFILMLEGTLMLAGAATRRFRAGEWARAAFPFTVETVAAGFGSSALRDADESRGEIWLPLWHRPAVTGELRQLLGEGRADVSGRPARSGVDFARAVSSLGVDRGIDEFTRFVFLKRSGKAFLAAPVGRSSVTERREVDLLREIDPWLERLRSECAGSAVPDRLRRALRRIDSAIFDFCRYGGPMFFQRVLVALGRAERDIAGAGRLREKLRPISDLSSEWLNAATDRTPEFAIAAALAFIHDPELRIGTFRTHLEAVEWRSPAAWAKRDRSVVWNAADLSANLARVLQRRLMDGERNGCEDLPLQSRCAAPLSAVTLFMEGELDDERIEELVWGLMLIDPGRRTSGHAAPSLTSALADAPPLPREYALLKLLFLPRPLVAERSGGDLRWRLAGRREQGMRIRPEPRALPLLSAGRVGEACRIAAHRLRTAGLTPMPGPLPSGATRDDSWSELRPDLRRAQRLAAALLIPIDSWSPDHLVELVCRDNLAVQTRTAASAGRGIA